jgi:hypothetical protein
MAANTAFADFPRLCALMAGDGFLPRQLTYKSSRLVFSSGVFVLVGASAALITVFNAHTSNLIPLYAIGVFLGFTLSQFGMVRHWATELVALAQKIALMPKSGANPAGGSDFGRARSDLQRERHHVKVKMVVNFIGGLASCAVMTIFAVTKFMTGAWITVLLIPLIVYMFHRIHLHYVRVAQFLSLPWQHAEVAPYGDMRTVILIDDVNIGTLRMVKFAKTLGNPWIGLHINFDEARGERVRAKWNEMIGDGELKVIHSPFRFLLEPVMKFIVRERDKMNNGVVHVITGQLIVRSTMGGLLHSANARGLYDELKKIERVIVTNVPYQLDRRESSPR